MSPARVIPFPPAARVGQIRRTAEYCASTSPTVSEAHVRVQVERLADSLARKGVLLPTVARECAAYEAAVRAVILRLKRATPGGGAS